MKLGEAIQANVGACGRHKSLSALLLGSSLSLAGFAAPAMAQEAAESASNSDVIIVTARKREETLQDTSAAVSVLGGDRLMESGVADVRDIQTLVPTVTIGEVVGLMRINVRGLGNSTNTRSEDPDVVLHEDGAVISRMEAQASAFFDLERVEVLRGPQGTLYGRNSTGGTINLITRKPTDEFEGNLDVSVGNYDLFRVDAAVGGPVTDWLQVRGAVQMINRSGYGENIFTGNDIDDQKRSAGRLHMLFQPTENVDFLLTAEYTNQDDASGLFTYLSPLTIGTPHNPAGGYSNANSRDGAGNVDPQLERDTRSITGTLDWQLNDNWSIRNIFNYRDLDFLLAQDLDLSTATTRTAVVTLPLHDEQFSEEFQFIYSGDRLNALAGLYYYEETFGGTTNVGTGVMQGVFFVLEGESKTEAQALFWNASYDLNEMFTLRAGGRYNEEDRSIVNDRYVNGARTTPAGRPGDDERSLSKYTGEYGFDVNFDPNNMLYYTYSQGFRSGAALIFQVASGIIDPTEVSNHELGYKFASPDGRLSANLALFSAQIENLQATQAILVDGLLTTKVNNVNDLETYGAELDLAWSPTDNFRISSAIAYLHAEYKDFVSDDPLIAGTNPIQVSGNTPRLSPEFKGNIHLEYDFQMANDARLTLGGDISYIGEQFFDEFNRAPWVEDAYTLFDASLRYHPSSEDWSVALWGKNLTDEERFSDLTFSALGGVQSKQFIAPQTWGVSFHHEF